MNFKSNAQRKAYFKKHKDEGWHYKDDQGYHSSVGSGDDYPISNKELTKRDREQKINGDYFKGKPYKLVTYKSGSPSIMRGIGKLKQYDKKTPHYFKKNTNQHIWSNKNNNFKMFD